ncbi:MAG TPA: ADP-ribosylation factor-directed GTPase activating protein isoform b, partial [Pirellulaceae bacterium]|nr:ADP-ribosylation factor-directed GTPase activating protein isoform b [Pirellulaceae bacterium]
MNCSSMFRSVPVGFVVALVIGAVVGCGGGNQSPATTAETRPVARGGPAAGDVTLPGDDEILRQIDEALEYTYDHRRLSVGSTANDQAAWQIVHGALAFKREFLVSDGMRDVSAVDYILAGGKMKGLDLRRGDLLDEATKRYGIATVIAEDKMGQGHQDQWLGYLSDCHLSLDQPIVVEGEKHTISDYIDQAKLDVNKNTTLEFSWTLMALTAYYPTDYTWKAGDGSEWNIAKLVDIELGHNLDASACGGTHRMTGLTMAFNRHVAAGKPVTGAWKKLEDRIHECIEKAQQYQNSDGSLSSNYFARPGKSADLAVCMGSAGHVLEFLCTA